MKRLFLLAVFLCMPCSAMMKKVLKKSQKTVCFYSDYQKKILPKIRHSVFGLIAHSHMDNKFLMNLNRDDVQQSLAHFVGGTITDYGKEFQSIVQTIAAEYGLRMPDFPDCIFQKIEADYAKQKGFHSIKGLFDRPAKKEL